MPPRTTRKLLRVVLSFSFDSDPFGGMKVAVSPDLCRPRTRDGRTGWCRHDGSVSTAVQEKVCRRYARTLR